MKRLKEFMILNLSLLAFLLLMIWIRPIEPLRDYSINNQMDFSGKILIYGDNVVSQKIVCEADSDTIELLYVPIGDPYNGSLRIDITSDDGDLSASWITHRYDMKPDGLMKYHIDKVMKKAHAYTITLSAQDLTEENAVMVSLGDEPFKVHGIDEFSYSGSAYQEGAYDDKVLSINVYKQVFNIFALCASITVFILVNVWLVLKDKGIEYYAIPVLLLSGVIMLFILVPGGGMDENYHYYSSYRQASVILHRSNPYEIENRHRYDFYMIDELAGCNANSSFIKTLNGLKGIEAYQEGTFEYEGHVAPIGQIFPHLAPAIGIAIGRLLKLNMIGIYTFGRIFNLILYVLLAYLGIRLIPVNKELMLLAAMMPICMQQCCSLSYDSIVNGLVFVYVGYIYRIVYEKKTFAWKHLIIPLLILVIISPVKYIYGVLALLILLISKDKLRILIPAIAIPFVVLLIVEWNVISPLFSLSVSQGDPVLYSLGAILHDPFRFIKTCLWTMDNNIVEYCRGMVGSMMTGDFTRIPEYLVIIYVAVMILCAISCKDKIIDQGWQRFVIIGTCIAGTAVMLLAFAMTQTLYSSPMISGLQGRYFIPYFIPLLYCGGKGRITADFDRTRLFIPIWFVEAGYVVSIMSQIRVNL